MEAPSHGPKSINWDHQKGEDGRKCHAVVEENPDAAHELSKWPASQDIVQSVKAHSRNGYSDVGNCQIYYVIVKQRTQAFLFVYGKQDEDVAENCNSYQCI